MVTLAKPVNASSDAGYHPGTFVPKNHRGTMTPLPFDHVQVAMTNARRRYGDLNFALLRRAKVDISDIDGVLLVPKHGCTHNRQSYPTSGRGTSEECIGVCLPHPALLRCG